MKHPVNVTREQLYEDVWSEPMTKLSKKYGMSDVGLAKVCKRNNIPRPTVGYWEKVAHGKKTKKKPLPTGIDVKPILFHAQFDNIGKEDPTLPDKVQGLIEFETDPANRIIVPDRLSTPHLLTCKIRENLADGKPDHYGRINSACAPQIWVSEKLIHRAVRVMDTLIKALETRGYIDCIFEQPISFGIHETLSSEMSEHGKEQMLKEKHPARHLFYYDRWASGRLKVVVLTKMPWRGKGLQQNWVDGKVRRIENYLNQFVCGLIRWAAIEREQNMMWAREKREGEESDRVAIEKATKEAERKTRIDQLYEDAGNWTEARQLREYIAAVALINPRNESKKCLDKWVHWAQAEADRIDPLKIT